MSDMADLPSRMTDKIKDLSVLRIGQIVTLISQDAGVPDSREMIVGLDVGFSGLENIALCSISDSIVVDGYTLKDIRT